LFVGALLGVTAVACGALGAHGLRSLFQTDGLLDALDERRLANWETAARYQMYHALALLAVGMLAREGGRVVHWAGAAMTIGTLVFSGCLYALVLTDQKWLGAVVPIGGMLLIVGWMMLAAAVIASRRAGEGFAEVRPTAGGTPRA
jgi:uncharacterized membrane protein YgdD (TMEM256/DUF423 family)